MPEKGFIQGATDFMFGSNKANVEPNTTSQQTSIPVETVAPSIPDYMLELKNLKMKDVTRSKDISNYDHTMRVLNVVPRGANKDGYKICIVFELTDFRTPQEWYMYTEEKTLYGLKTIGQVRAEFKKYKGFTQAKAGLDIMPQNIELFQMLSENGWPADRLLTNYVEQPVIKKLYHILEDCNVLDRFENEMQFDLFQLKGSIIRARINRGNKGNYLCSLGYTADEQYTETTDAVDVADYGLDFGPA